MSVLGPVERLFPESTKEKGVVGKFEAVLAAVSLPNLALTLLKWIFCWLLLPMGAGDDKKAHTLCCPSSATTVIQFWMCAKPQYYELNIVQCGSATKQIGASRETASVSLA